VRVGIQEFLEKEIAFIISCQIVFQEFLMGADVPECNLRIIIHETYVIILFRVVDKAGIVSQVKKTPSPAVRRIEQVPKGTGIQPVADRKKDLLLENLVYVTVELPDRGPCRDKFRGKESYAVYRGWCQVGVDS